MESKAYLHQPLSGKIAIITGSSKGIGAAMAERLAADGANIVINYHKVDACAYFTTNNINARGRGKAVIVKADVATADGRKYLLDQCVERLGVPNILVLNAGMVGHRELAEIDEEFFDANVETNVKGPLFLAQAASKLMKKGSRIIFVSSALTQASYILPMGLLFAATKGSIEQIVRVLAKDLRGKGITVNAIAPGPVDTTSFREGKPVEVIEWVASLHPQKRVPEPQEVVPLVAFLSTDEAGWINGQSIGVNGGYCV